MRHGLLSIQALCFSLLVFVSASVSASDELYEMRLDKGLINTYPYSDLLMQMAREDSARSREYLEQAKRYSPDLPSVYFTLAKSELSFSPQGLFQGLEYFRQGIKAYGRNFVWGYSLSGLLYISMVISVVLSLLLVLILRVPLEAGLVVHEVLEDKRKSALLLVPMLLSLFGPVALIAGICFIIGLYYKKGNKAVVILAMLLFLCSTAIVNTALMFLAVPPHLKAIAEVNEGRDNRYALWQLKKRTDYASSFSYTLALKREGNYQEAIERYNRLSSPDPRIQVNIGNAYYALKNLPAAEESYNKALTLKPLPSAFYNLSQIYREMLDFPKGDEYFHHAAQLSSDAVSRFRAVAGTHPNRFVIDESLAPSVLWESALRGNITALTPSSILTAVLALLTLAAFYSATAFLKHRAYRCKKCNNLYCSKCSKSLTWGDMCPQCYRSLVKIEEIDVRERVSQLLSIYQRQTRKRTVAKALSYMLPGAGQIFSGRILSGFLLAWFFFFPATSLLIISLRLIDSYPVSHAWLMPFMLICIGLSYSVSILQIRRVIQRGWL